MWGNLLDGDNIWLLSDEMKKHPDQVFTIKGSSYKVSCNGMYFIILYIFFLFKDEYIIYEITEEADNMKKSM